jgi:hypothetical protein
MDAVGLEILERELAADRKVLADAAGKAEQRIVESNPGHLEACAGRGCHLRQTTAPTTLARSVSDPR